MVHWAHPSPLPKRHFDRFSRFCGAHDRDRPTDRQTDHATPSVTIGRIYDVCSTAMRPIIITKHLYGVVRSEDTKGGGRPTDGLGESEEISEVV